MSTELGSLRAFCVCSLGLGLDGFLSQSLSCRVARVLPDSSITNTQRSLPLLLHPIPTDLVSTSSGGKGPDTNYLFMGD